MGIVSDVTVRTLIVKGKEEVERIKHLNKRDHIMQINKQEENLYEIKITYKVGDHAPKGGE